MPREKKFLFFWAGGGWDTTAVLDPHYGSTGVDMEPDSVLGQRGALAWTSGPARLQTDRFFRRWGSYSTIVNGIDVHSVGHDSAAQFVLTGTSASSFSDWPTLLAANSRYEYPLPHVVFSGPSYAGTYGAAVVLYGLGGWWLDGKLGTSPLFLLIGVGLGAVGGFIWVYREVLRAEARSRAKKAAEAGEREGESTSK